MTRSDLTHLYFLLDRSGSMQSIKSDIEGGFAAFVDEQRKAPGDCLASLSQFDDAYEVVYADRPLSDVPALDLRPRNMTALHDAMGRLIAHRGWEVDLKVQGVFGRWAELVGQEVADHCTPESFDEGRLVVRTDSTAWATQLKLLAPSVVRRLNEELGHGTVTVIEVLGPHLPTWTKGRLSSRDGRGPRDTYG